MFEYVPRNLLEVLEERPGGLDPTLVRRYIWQLVKAIAWCHRHDIVHRDIKPENLLVGPDDTRSDALKLCDFGFARQLKRHKPDEVLTDYVATRWYRAPELLLGSEKYGTEVDTWAIGCIMGELTDGQPLFPGESDVDQLHIVCKSMGAMTGKQRETLSNNERFNGVRFPRESNGGARDRGMDHLRSRYSNKLNNAALRFMRGTLVMDPAERLTWQGMLTHPYFEGEDGWTERSPLSENTVQAATRTGPEKLSDTSTSSIERKRSSSCAPVTSPTTPKVSERRERRMKENAERLRVETEAQARTRSIKAETAETGRRESELEAAAREARAARERRERERAEREERERVAKAKAAATESVYSTSAAASRRRREKFGVGTSSSLNARLPTRAPGANPIHDGSKLGGLTHDADATAEYVVGKRQYGSFGAKPGGIAELRSRYASRVLGAATHGHSRSSYAPPEVFVDEDDAAARGTGGGRHHLARLSSNVAANGVGGTMNPMHPGAAARKSLMDRDERVKRTSLSTLAAAAPRAERPTHEPTSMLLNGTSMSIGVSGRSQTRGGMGVGGAPTRLAPLKMSAGLGPGVQMDPYGSLGRRGGGFEERGPRRGTVGGGLGAGWR